MTEEKDYIAELFTSAGPFDEKAVVDVLKPLVSIQQDSYAVYFLADYLTVDDRILAFALVRKLLKAKGHNIEDEYISAKRFHKMTGLPKGSVDSAFKRLRERRFLVGKGQVYEIPNLRIPKVLQRLKLATKVEDRKSNELK